MWGWLLQIDPRIRAENVQEKVCRNQSGAVVISWAIMFTSVWSAN